MTDLVPPQGGPEQVLTNLTPDPTNPVAMPDTSGFQTGVLPPEHPSGGQLLLQEGKLGEFTRPTWGEQFMGALKAQQYDSAIGWGGEGTIPRLLYRNFIENDLQSQNSPKISAEEANKRFPGLPKPFDEPVYPEVAQIAYDTYRARTQDSAYLATGSGLGWGAKTALFGAGFFDPGNLALIAGSVVTGGGIGAAAEAVGPGIFFKEATKKGVTSLVPRLSAVALENLAISTALEVPSYTQQKAERQDVTIADAAQNIALSTAIGVGIHTVLGKAFEAFSGDSKELKLKKVEATIAALEQDARPDLTPFDNTSRLRASGAVVTGSDAPIYEFSKMGHASERTFYGGVNHDGVEVSHGDGYAPDSRSLTDNPNQSNNLVSNPDGVDVGSVGTFQLPSDINLVNLDEPLPKSLLSQAIAEMKKAGLDESMFSKEQLANAPGKDVFNLLKGLEQAPDSPSALEVMKTRAQGEGFDGYQYVHDAGGKPSNGVEIFDPAKAELKSEQVANKDQTPRMSISDMQAADENIRSPENKLSYDPEIAAKVEKLKAEKMPALTEVEQSIKDQMDHEERLLKAAAENDPMLKAEMDAIRREDATRAQLKDLAKRMSDCAMETLS